MTNHCLHKVAGPLLTVISMYVEVSPG